MVVKGVGRYGRAGVAAEYSNWPMSLNVSVAYGTALHIYASVDLELL